MLRKTIRMRRQYLYNQENEKKNKKKYQDKQKLQNAHLEQKHIPTELYQQEGELNKEMEVQDENTIIPRSKMDDEYANVTYRDPSILITTSRNASQRLVQFMKVLKKTQIELCLVFPNTTRINRGAYVTKDLVKVCHKKNFTDLIIVHEHRGEPDGMIISHFPLGPTIYIGIKNCVLRHDLKEQLDTVSEAFPHLIFHGFSTALGERVVNILQNLFPVPKEESKKVITFANNNDVISFRNMEYEKSDYKTVQLSEVGPRFQIKPYQISLGTLDQTEATKEWVLRPFMSTATQRKAF